MKSPRTLLKALLIGFVVAFALTFNQVLDNGFLLLVPALALAYAGFLAAVALRRRGRAMPQAEARS